MAEPYELSLNDYWRVLRKRRGIIILSFLVISTATFMFSMLQPTIYEVSSTVQYSEQRSKIDLLNELVNYQIGDVMLSQTKVVNSWSVMELAAQEMGSVKPDTPAEQANQIIASLQSTVSAQIEPNTNLIIIRVRSSDPKKAAEIANATALAYLQFNLMEKSKANTQLRQTVENRLNQVLLKLTKSEDELRFFKEQNPGVSSGASASYNQYEDLKKRLEELKGKFTDKHPEIIKLNTQLEVLQKELSRYPQKELAISRLERAVIINNALYADLKSKAEKAFLDEAEKTSDVTIVNRAIPPSKPIKPNKTTNQMVGSLLGLMVGFVLAFVVEHLDTSIGTIEDLETLLKLPVLGVIPYLSTTTPDRSDPDVTSGRKPSAGRDWLDWLFGSPSPVREEGRERDYAESRSEEIRNQLVINYSPTSPIAEAYRILRTNILRVDKPSPENTITQSGLIASPGEPKPGNGQYPPGLYSTAPKGKIIVVTSTGPDEGKTITSANLSITMAQKGEHTLLVDGDMRKALVHRIFGLDKAPGLSDILMGAYKFDKVVRTITDTLIGGLNWDLITKTIGIDNLHIITAGSGVQNPSELLSSAESDLLLRELRARYSYIIIDCPPVLPVTDVLVLGPKSDMLVMVYRAGKTARGALVRARDQLVTAHIRIKGLCLNHMSPEIEISPTYYYRRYHYYSSRHEVSG
ncbi:MAG: polysaccharide biosynthesis tyrosine autokinase [Planctomycetes bacterium]|nr:polysaccharide biosynthesis tyrosine autokinase [Planctomycetota bacterium]